MASGQFFSILTKKCSSSVTHGFLRVPSAPFQLPKSPSYGKSLEAAVVLDFFTITVLLVAAAKRKKKGRLLLP